MADDVALALAVADQIRRGASKLPPAAARALEEDLRKIERKLQGDDPYAKVQDIVGFQEQLRQSSGGGQPQTSQPTSQPAPQQAPPPAAPPPMAQTAQI